MDSIVNGLRGVSDAVDPNEADAAGGLLPAYGTPAAYTAATGLPVPYTNNNMVLYAVIAALALYILLKDR